MNKSPMTRVDVLESKVTLLGDALMTLSSLLNSSLPTMHLPDVHNFLMCRQNDVSLQYMLSNFEEAKSKYTPTYNESYFKDLLDTNNITELDISYMLKQRIVEDSKCEIETATIKLVDNKIKLEMSAGEDGSFFVKTDNQDTIKLMSHTMTVRGFEYYMGLDLIPVYAPTLDSIEDNIEAIKEHLSIHLNGADFLRIKVNESSVLFKLIDKSNITDPRNWEFHINNKPLSIRHIVSELGSYEKLKQLSTALKTTILNLETSKND